jgi:hypothetical protein
MYIFIHYKKILKMSISNRKLSKKQLEVDLVFCPDVSGCSVWIDRDIIAKNETLNWGNNGNGRHGIYFGDNRYVWEKQMANGRISSLRTGGFSQDELYGASRPIRPDIHKYHKEMGCVVCGSHSDLVTDHKDDTYSDSRVLDASTQTIDDFQCLCNHCNLQKRQVCKKSKELGKRIGATNIKSLEIFGVDFIEGDETLDMSSHDPMKGTFWHDPVEFMKKIREQIKP